MTGVELAPEGGELAPRAVKVRVSRSREVKKRVRVTNPGRALFRAMTRAKDRVDVEKLPDVDVLSGLIPPRAARSVMERIGTLSNLAALGQLSIRALLDLDGVDEATAARLYLLFELAARLLSGEPEEGEG